MIVSTFTDPVSYNRIPSVKDSVRNFLQCQFIHDPSTEVFTEILHKISSRKCEDRLEVIMEAEELN